MQCIIGGCRNTANNTFGVRLRNLETNAVWAPNTGALICDAHAVAGIRVNVVLEATTDHRVQTTVSSPGGVPVVKSMRITKEP